MNGTDRPKPRRSNPYKRITKSGKVRWDAVAYVIPRDPETGMRASGPLVPKSKTFDRQRDAEDWLDDMKVLKKKRLAPVSTKTTLGEYLATWLEGQSHRVRAVTMASYRGTIKRWVLKSRNAGPALGDLPLSELDADPFERLYLRMADGDLTREVKYLHGILKRALKLAVTKKILPANPLEGATVPEPNAEGLVEEPSSQSFTADQAARFLRAASKDRLAALWYVLLTGGLRPSEALGLKWSDVHLDRGEVFVRQALSRVVDKTKHPAGWALTTPKTKKSIAFVPLPDVTVQELRKWKVEQTKERLRVGADWQDHGFVFTSEWGTPFDLRNLRGRSFNRVMRAAGLGTYIGSEPTKPRRGPTKQRVFKPSHRIYDLRHSCATLAQEAGADLLTVSRLLRHSTIKLTADTYTHGTSVRQREVAGHFDRMFGTG